jgi:nucleoside-diphosphate-sugar epimerase
MKVLLTGAIGFLGFRTLEKLIELDHVISIIASGRVIKNTHFIEHPKVTHVLGELGNETFVDELVQQVDSIIRVAALSSPWGKSDQFYKANVIPHENLIKSALKFNIERIIC